MARVVLFLSEIVLVVYCLIDAVQTPPHEVRRMPRWAWVVLILLAPWAGAIGWLVAGSPRSLMARQETAGSRPTQVAPDDDPDFLRGLDLRKPHPGDDEQV